MSITKERKDIIKTARHYQRNSLIQMAVLVAANICLISDNCVFAQESKSDLQEHIKLAQHYHDLSKYSQSKKELDAALKLDPKNPEILNSLGSIYLNLSESAADKEERLNNLVLARKYFTAAISNDPDFAAAWNGMAGVYYLNAENTKAISCYKKALALTPKRAYEVYTNLANTLRDCEQTREAEENYKKAIELNPLYAPAHNGYAELLYNKQRLAEALSEVLEAIKLKPAYATAYYHLGLIECADGTKIDALKAYLLSLRYEKNPRYAQDTQLLISQLGVDINSISPHDLQQFQDKLSRETLPLQVVHEVKKDTPSEMPEESVQSRLNNIQNLMSNKDWGHSASEVSVLLKKYPDDAVLLNDQGLIYLNQKKYLIAQKFFEKAFISSHGKGGAICYNLSQAYVCNHNFSKAKEYLEKAKQLSTNTPLNLALIDNTLGRVLKQKGDLTGARTAYEEAIANGGKQYPVFHYNLGVLLEKMNQRQEAEKEFHVYLQLDPNGLNVKNAQNHLKKIISAS